MSVNGDATEHSHGSFPQEWSIPAQNKFPLKKIPEPLHVELIPQYESRSDQAELEAQTPTAHKPTLKGVGKSDCEVKIVSISECESEIPLDAFADKNSRTFWPFLNVPFAELMGPEQSGRVMPCRMSSPMPAHSHQRTGTRFPFRDRAQLKPGKLIEDPFSRLEEARRLHVCPVSPHVQRGPVNMLVGQRSAA